MGRWVCIEEGTVDIAPRYEGDRIRDHIIPGTFPYRYWNVVYLEDNETLHCPDDETIEQEVKRCKRCNREIKPRYTYCYRCHNYLKVKARIAA